MWTKNWHRFLQGIYGACKRIDSDSAQGEWLHDDEGSGISPRFRTYCHGDLKWIDVFTNATSYQQPKLDTPPKKLINNSQLAIPSIEYLSTTLANATAFGYISCQLGSGQATDEYTAVELASPILSGFTIQNLATGTQFDSEENKHKKTLSISLVNSSSSDITVSEFGLFMRCAEYFSNGFTDSSISPALVFYERFSPATISSGAIFRIVIEQEMPVLEVTTQ